MPKSRLECEADPNVCVSPTSTVLIYAIEHVHVDIARLLLEHKANPAMHPAVGLQNAWKAIWHFKYDANLFNDEFQYLNRILKFGPSIEEAVPKIRQHYQELFRDIGLQNDGSSVSSLPRYITETGERARARSGIKSKEFSASNYQAPYGSWFPNSRMFD